MYTHSRGPVCIRRHLGQRIVKAPALDELRLRNVKALVNDAPRRQCRRRPCKASRHPKPVKPDRPPDPRSCQGHHSRSREHLAMGHPAAAAAGTTPHGRTEGAGGPTAQHRPHHRRGPTQCGPQRAGPGHPAEIPCQPQAWPTRRTAGRTTGQCTKRCDRDSNCAPSSASSPAHAVAEQHTAARSSCTVPT
jgi:hypothetical protein